MSNVVVLRAWCSFSLPTPSFRVINSRGDVPSWMKPGSRPVVLPRGCCRTCQLAGLSGSASTSPAELPGPQASGKLAMGSRACRDPGALETPKADTEEGDGHALEIARSAGSHPTSHQRSSMQWTRLSSLSRQGQEGSIKSRSMILMTQSSTLLTRAC